MKSLKVIGEFFCDWWGFAFLFLALLGLLGGFGLAIRSMVLGDIERETKCYLLEKREAVQLKAIASDGNVITFTVPAQSAYYCKGITYWRNDEPTEGEP